MYAIAESGSTKTDWYIYDKANKESMQFPSAGINPYFSTEATIKETLNNSFERLNPSQIQQLDFYGPGCSLPEMQEKLRKELHVHFINASVKVHSDLLAAARGLFGSGMGIACILGTGSNSGVYENSKIIENLPSLGYMFGDEGSGAYMGKHLISDFLNDNMPHIVKNKFLEKYNLSYKDILTNVYSKPYPNRFLASFACFLSENISFAYSKKIVDNAFDAFFTKQLSKYPNYEKQTIRFTGSIAYTFSDILVKVAQRHHILIHPEKDIVKSPLAGLIDFHFKHNNGL